jgi:histidyl-tRNA synthetase
MGFGMGIERVVANLGSNLAGAPAGALKVVVAHVGDPARSEAVTMASSLRRAGVAAVVAPSRGLKSQMRYASSVEASHAVIVGEDEMRAGTSTVRDLAEGEQRSMAREELAVWLTERSGSAVSAATAGGA